MTAKLLEKHITDTIREWQVKIGYEGGTMKLYYPAESLRRSLSLDETEDLDAALAAFCKEVQPRLGTLAISAVKDRYCMEIPEEGCSYIERKIPVPELLQNLLQVITTPGNTMEQVRNCFSSYAEKMHTTVEENASEEHEMGHVFSFSDPSVDEYCYCVEENEFGLTYHRFSREDYRGFIIKEDTTPWNLQNCWKKEEAIRRVCSGEHVTAEQIQEIVQAAIQAPS